MHSSDTRWSDSVPGLEDIVLQMYHVYVLL